MSRLTWQNVSAPSFAGVSDSYRTMSQLLGQATESGSAMVDTFTKARSDAADRQIMERMLGVQSPEQFNPQTIVGGQGGRASMAMLDKIGAYQDTLIDRDIATDTHAQNQRDWSWVGDARTQMQANGPAINAALADAAAGKPGAAERLAALPLRADVMNTLLTQNNAATDARLDQNASRFDMSKGEYGFTREKADDAFADSAADDANYLYQQGFGIGNPTMDEQIISSTGWDARRLARARAAVGGSGTAASGGGAASVTGAISSAAAGPSAPIGSSSFRLEAPQQSVATALTGSKMPPAVVAGFLGNFHVEGGYGGGKGDGGTASGIVQWRGDRRTNFIEQIGKDPSEATPEEQMEFVNWEMANPEKAGMTVAQRDQILAAKDPAEAAVLIDKFYERSDGKARDRRISAANDAFSVLGNATGRRDPNNTGMPDYLLPNTPTPSRFADPNAAALFDVVRANTGANSGSLNSRIAQLEGDETDMGTLVKGLKEGSYVGYSDGEIADKIRELASKNKINNSQAAFMLSELVTDRNPLMSGVDKTLDTLNQVPVLNWLIPDSTIAENTYDNDQLDQAGRDYSEGGPEAIAMNQQRARIAQELTVSQQKVEELRASLVQAQQRYRATNGSPAVAARIKSIEGQMATAQMQQNALQLEQENLQWATTADLSAPARRLAEEAAAAQQSTPEAVRKKKEEARERMDRFLSRPDSMM